MIVLLLMLPAFVAAKIQIGITPGTDTSQASVQFYGSATWPITETDQQAFHITNADVQSARKIMLVKKPKEVFIRQDQHHEGVKVTMKPTSAGVVDFSLIPVEIASKQIRNIALMPTAFKMDFKEDVNEIIRIKWSSCPELGGLDTIAVAVGKFSLTSHWGKEEYRPMTRTISVDSDELIHLSPGQNVTGVLKAMKMSIKVRVDYEASLAGNVCVLYKWLLTLIPDERCYDVSEYLTGAMVPRALQATETITVVYYYGAKVELKEGPGFSQPYQNTETKYIQPFPVSQRGTKNNYINQFSES